MTRATRAYAVAVLIIAGGVAASAQETPAPSTGDDKGRAIAAEFLRRSAGFGDFTADVEITRQRGGGSAAHMTLHMKVLEQANGRKRRLVSITEPRPLRGVSLLTLERDEGGRDVWIYVPMTRQVRRLGLGDKTNPMLENDFAMQDIAAFRPEDVTARYLRNEPCAGLDCAVLELEPNNAGEEALRLRAWVDLDEYRVHKAEVLDAAGGVKRTMTLSGYRDYADAKTPFKTWRPERIEAAEPASGKTATVIFSNIRFRTGLTEKDLDKKSLEMNR